MLHLQAMDKTIYLASRSPRRGEILQQLGVHYHTISADVDETPAPGEAPDRYVLRLAEAKARAGLASLAAQQLAPLPLLAADTTVCVDGVILGKPQHDEHAYAMLSSMAGRSHQVYTAVALAYGDELQVELSTTTVEMALLSEHAIRAYIASGEPRDKAGAYGIQGLGGALIKHIAGSYSGVMGLPVYETAALLARAGIHIL